MIDFLRILTAWPAEHFTNLEAEMKPPRGHLITSYPQLEWRFKLPPLSVCYRSHSPKTYNRATMEIHGLTYKYQSISGVASCRSRST